MKTAIYFKFRAPKLKKYSKTFGIKRNPSKPDGTLKNVRNLYLVYTYGLTVNYIVCSGWGTFFNIVNPLFSTARVRVECNKT